MLLWLGYFAILLYVTVSIVCMHRGPGVVPPGVVPLSLEWASSKGRTLAWASPSGRSNAIMPLNTCALTLFIPHRS